MMTEVPDSKEKKSFKENSKKFVDSNLGITAIILAVIIPCITLWVWAATTKDWGVDLTGQNELGDALGGITAPFIGITTSILTFLAFWVQYKFNKEQLKFNKEQNDFSKKQLDFAENQEMFIKMQLIESKVASLNHTFDLLQKQNFDKKSSTDFESFTRFFRTYWKENYKNIPSELMDLLRISKVEYMKTITSSEITIIVEGSIAKDIINVCSSLFHFAYFIYTTKIALSNPIFEKTREVILSDYISKCFMIIPLKLADLFIHILILDFHAQGIDIRTVISSSHNETPEIIARYNAIFLNREP